ncbi:MAG: hypothetical protein COA69_02990 [Robiginitomaculum sp.]|nr:MAG: hypothetical protein COA69_02990 [Robiginitomaculum sp.]
MKRRIQFPILIIGFAILLAVLLARSHLPKKSDNLVNELNQYCTDETYVCGFIDEGFERRIKKRIDQKVRIIKISSQGGFQRIAMRIANQLNESEVSVIIDGACLSACAQSIFLGTKNISISNRSFVAFHHSSTFLNLVARMRFVHNEKFLNYATKNSGAEIEFFDEYKLDYGALLIPAANMNYICAASQPVYQKGDYSLMMESQYDWYIPDMKLVLDWRGGRSFKSWPSNLDELKIRSENFPIFFSRNIVYFSGNKTAEGLEDHIKKTKTCKI